MSRDPDAELDLDELARRAAEGDRGALADLVRGLQHPFYRLALRFLGHPQDAEDATQEILIRIVTHLGSFAGRSKFTTWAYTVATRSLLRAKRGANEAAIAGAEEFAAFLDAGIGDIDTTADEAEYRLLCDEVRISCTYGMLLCIPRDQRAAYLLADVAGLTDIEGAQVLDCSRDAFRQRVSRARRTLKQVIDNRCGLINPASPCRCGRQITAGLQAGILRPRRPSVRHPPPRGDPGLDRAIRQTARRGHRHRRPLPLRPVHGPRRPLARPAGPLPRTARPLTGPAKGLGRVGVDPCADCTPQPGVAWRHRRHR
jgi:RNA polymerase sigma factor (sigma-70 family)